MAMKILSPSNEHQCVCGSQLPDGSAANRLYCDECRRQRNRDHWTHYSHSRTPISSPCAGGCGTELLFQHDQMGRPPKYCASCRTTISQQRHRKGKRPSGKTEGGPAVKLSPEQKQPFLAAFQELPEIAQRTLSYWIGHTIQPSRSIESRSSRLLVRDFASEAFLVNEIEFKGAMLACGYQPTDEKEEQWRFPIQRKSPDGHSRYSIICDPHFNRLVEAVDAYFEQKSLS